MKHQNLLKKHVYFTVIQRCEQGLRDTFILADIAMDQFCEDFPLVNEAYIKFDNWFMSWKLLLRSFVQYLQK